MTGQRPCADEIMRGLRTTSDKIRALFRAGYTRTEIRDLLGIRYQHVRKVLVEAGMDGRLQRQTVTERSLAPPMAEAATGRAPCEALLHAGFQVLGEWTLSGGGAIALTARAPIEPGVYAFVVDDAVAYIGLTQTGLRTRMDHYRRGHERQRTSARVKG